MTSSWILFKYLYEGSHYLLLWSIVLKTANTFLSFSKMLLVIHCIHHRRKKNNHSQRLLRLSVKFRVFAAFNLNLMTNDGNGRWRWRFLKTRAPMPISEMFEILKWQQIHICLNVCSVYCTKTSSQPTRIHCPPSESMLRCVIICLIPDKHFKEISVFVVVKVCKIWVVTFWVGFFMDVPNKLAESRLSPSHLSTISCHQRVPCLCQSPDTASLITSVPHFLVRSHRFLSKPRCVNTSHFPTMVI